MVGYCENTIKPKVSFWFHFVDTKSAVLSLLTFTNELMWAKLALIKDHSFAPFILIWLFCRVKAALKLPGTKYG